MVKNVMELLEEINKGNFEKLPEKIKIDDEIFEKDDEKGNYFEKGFGISLLEIIADDTSKNLLESLKLPVEEVKEGMWKPKVGEEYWYVYDCEGPIVEAIWDNRDIDNNRYYLNNCFKTEKGAEQHLENLKTEVELRQLAEKLNGNEEIDWEDIFQEKNYLVYDFDEDDINDDYTCSYLQAHQIYCLNKKFKDKAIKKIGKEKLKKYLREE